MNYFYNLPEILIIGNNLTNKDYQILINEINCYARDKHEIELGKDYTEEIIIKEELEFETYPEDEHLPEEKRRLKSKKGKKFKLVNIDKPLVFREYNAETEELFPCGYLRYFNYYFIDDNSIKVIYADLR